MKNTKDLTEEFNAAVRAMFPEATGCTHDATSTRVYFTDGSEKIVSHIELIAKLGEPNSILNEATRKFLLGF